MNTKLLNMGSIKPKYFTLKDGKIILIRSAELNDAEMFHVLFIQ